jgi:hypothetical protein
MQMFKRFNDTFGVSLRDYWIDNAKGLDVDKFSREVLNTGGNKLLASVKAQFGRNGVTVIKRLLPKPKRRKPA